MCTLIIQWYTCWFWNKLQQFSRVSLAGQQQVDTDLELCEEIKANLLARLDGKGKKLQEALNRITTRGDKNVCILSITLRIFCVIR